MLYFLQQADCVLFRESNKNMADARMREQHLLLGPEIISGNRPWMYATFVNTVFFLECKTEHGCAKIFFKFEFKCLNF